MGKKGHLVQTWGLEEGLQRRLLLKSEGASQGKGGVKVEEKGVLGRSGKTAWHLQRPTSISLARVLNASVSTCLHVCVCIHMCAYASTCACLGAGV